MKRLVVTTNVIAAMLISISKQHPTWFPSRNAHLTIKKIEKRYRNEGLGFLTKTLPALGKSFVQALSGEAPLNCHRFCKGSGTQLPILFGELFIRVFHPNGMVRPEPCVLSIIHLRNLCEVLYKLELPYAKNTTQTAIKSFETTDSSLPEYQEQPKEARVTACNVSFRVGLDPRDDHANGRRYIPNRTNRGFVGLQSYGFDVGRQEYVDELIGLLLGQSGGSDALHSGHKRCIRDSSERDQRDNWRDDVQLGHYSTPVARLAKRLLKRVLKHFDPRSITPRHGPGAVATGEKPWNKMCFKRHYDALNAFYSYPEYFYSGASHFHDKMHEYFALKSETSPIAKTCFVNKDSRGPRTISEEPLEIQWIQQGLGRALVSYIEAHPLTKGQVNFAEQSVNRNLALIASLGGQWATLDLKDASDRIALQLVSELYPKHLFDALMATRSTHTMLPDKRKLKLRKFASMGSTMCFPILALTIWALSVATLMVYYGTLDPYRVRELVFVYGDDLIIPKTQVSDVINSLELHDLRVNRAKSCTQGSFYESCGKDAFLGRSTEPSRLKTVFDHRGNSASTYASYISYANGYWLKGYCEAAICILRELNNAYGYIPTYKLASPYSLQNHEGIDILGYPYLLFDDPINDSLQHPRRRWNAEIQRFQYLVRCLKPKKVKLQRPDGHDELLRFLSKGSSQFTAGEYAVPRASMLVRRWR